jgi:DNA recombination protein Rad52
MIKSPIDVASQLDEKIPRDAVSSRSAGGGKALSYLESWYVIDRLNKVFGNLGWDSETTEMVLVSKPDEKPAYRAKVRITAIVKVDDGAYMKVTKEGTGWGSDKSNLNPHEMACKEAESDALKRAAMKFGMSLGLALYDKSQENVDDGPAPQAPAAAAPKTIKREDINEQISAISRVLISQKKRSKEDLFASLKKQYGVDSKEALTDSQAQALLTELRAIANG